MSHADCWELLAVYRDLDAAERAMVDAHLAECPECAARLLAWRRMDRDLAALADLRPDERLDARFAAAVAAHRRPWAARLERAGRVGNALAWAAVAVVAALLVAGLALAGRPLIQQAWPATQPTAAPTPGLGRVIVRDELIASYPSTTHEGNYPDLAPQLSPDGTRVACFVLDDEPGGANLLVVRNLATGQEEWKGLVNGALHSSARWSPDSRSLAFVVSQRREGGGVSSNLFRLDLEPRPNRLETLWAAILHLFGRSAPPPGSLHRLYGADDPHISSLEPALGAMRWTADGRYVEAFDTTGGPGLRVPAGGGPAGINVLPFSLDVFGATVGGDSFLSVPLPSPADDYWLAVVRTDSLVQVPAGAPAGGESLVRYDVRTKQAQVLASLAVGTHSNDVRVSPDGEWVGLLATEDDGATQSWFVRRDGTGLRQVPLSGGAFAWGAPGRIYFYVPPREVGTGTLYELDLASGRVGLVAGDWPEQALVAASPDGSGLLVARSVGDVTELHWLELAPRPQNEPTVAPEPTAAPEPTPTLTPRPTLVVEPTIPPGVVTYDGITFDYGPSIAAGVRPETVRANYDVVGNLVPEHVRFSFLEYALPDTSMGLEPRIAVYPVAEYAAVNGQAGETIESLRQLLSDPPAAPRAIPFLPQFNAGQMMCADIVYLDFQNGHGVRFLTQYNQSCVPINNQDMFYTFQGLTDDGAWYISAILPVAHPSLPADWSIALTSNWPGCVGMEDYLRGIVAQLDAKPAASFAPRLDLLDELIRSLRVRTPTAAPTITPVATGASIRADRWSPDGEWLTFWQAEEGPAPGELNPVEMLHFFNASTGETCGCPQLGAAAAHAVVLAWKDDGQVVIWNGETATWQGTPCGSDFRVVGGAPEAVAAEPRGAPSPGGRYRASTVEERTEDERIRASTTFTEAATGQTVQVVDYVHRGGLGSLGLGGEWVTDSLFLIRETLDRGPLLVDLESSHIIAVMPELFHLQQTPTVDVGFWAEAVPGADAYHIVLGGVGVEAAFPTLRLYHSETGQVEELEFTHPWSPLVSPDGRWLLMDERPDRWVASAGGAYESYAMWARPIDPPGGSAHLVAEGDYLARWSPDGSQIAMAGPGVFLGLPNVTSVYSFPEGRLLGSWATGAYRAQPDAWSPDGTRLAMSGNIPGEWQYGLFVVEP